MEVIHKRVIVRINPESIFGRLLESRFADDGYGFMITCVWNDKEKRKIIKHDIQEFIQTNRESYFGEKMYNKHSRNFFHETNSIVIFNLDGIDEKNISAKSELFKHLRKHCVSHRTPRNSVIVLASNFNVLTLDVIESSDFIFVPKGMQIDWKLKSLELEPPAKGTIIRY